MHKANALSKLNRIKEALECCEESIRCGVDTEATAAIHFRQVLERRLNESESPTTPSPS